MGELFIFFHPQIFTEKVSNVCFLFLNSITTLFLSDVVFLFLNLPKTNQELCLLGT